MIADFLSEAKAYCAARGITLVTLGVYAANDSRLFARLEGGGQCMPRTISRVRDFMAANPPVTHQPKSQKAS